MAKPDGTTGYVMLYECPRCHAEWHMNWSSACNDECTDCGATDIEPTTYELDGTHTQQELDAFNGCTK